jgi:SAM-dependent methyltransferase
MSEIVPSEAVSSSRLVGIYDIIMAPLERFLLTRRRKSVISQLEGDILEIGCGTGVNFPLYSASARVLACEPSPGMVKLAQKRILNGKIAARITIVETGIEDPELDSQIQPGKLDAVVCTLVLCTIPDPEDALLRISSWLKPGGKLILIEHIEPQNPLLRRLAHWLNPSWNKLADGCHLIRNTDRLWENSGFMPQSEQYFHFIIPFYQSVWVKPKAD